MLLQKFLKKKYKKNWKVEVGKDGLRYIHIRMIGTTKFKQQDFEESDKWVTGEFLVHNSSEILCFSTSKNKIDRVGIHILN